MGVTEESGSGGTGSGGSDTTAPTVSATETGTSGNITLAASASASDNVGVTKVEFYIDGALGSTATAAPYQASLDYTALSNGTHTLVAEAYDAAGNVGNSSSVSFSISNAGGSGTGTEPIKNGSFENGATSWT